MQRLQYMFVFVIFSLLCIGCNSSDSGSGDDHHGDDHHHGDHGAGQLSFPEMVAVIDEHRNQIKQAFAEGQRDEAHHPLHEIGSLIQKLPDAAAATDLSEEQWNEIKQASESLMAAFAQVDKLFHGDEEGVEYTEVENDVDQSMAVLQSKASSLSAESTEPQS